MLRTILPIAILIFGLSANANGQDRWPDARGPSGNFHLDSDITYPTKWSVISNENIHWRAPLPETGHSGIAVWDDHLFLTCFSELSANQTGEKGTWASKTRGYCLSAKTGTIQWKCELPGERPNQVNGVFTDSTTPTPITDGRHVWFVNAGGYMACYSVEGQMVWEREFEVRTKHSAKQFQPFLHDGKLYYVMMLESADPDRRPQTAKHYDKNSKAGWPWMYVRCFDAFTGEPNSRITQGISVHSKGALGSIKGKRVLLHAKGGGHSPPEKPYGVSLSLLSEGHELLWERQDMYFEGTHYVDDQHAFCFDRDRFHVLDLETGATVKEIKIRGQGSVVRFDQVQQRYLTPVPATNISARHLQTHRSNIGVGDYHFFMSGTPGFLGRIDVSSGELCYLQVPLQVSVKADSRNYSWLDYKSGDETGSGYQVQGDKRRLGHGFGHVSAATPIVVNDRIYFSTMLGTVYVIDARAEKFDDKALLAINDLGSPGKTWTLSSFAAANGYLYQRTSREIICIGGKP